MSAPLKFQAGLPLVTVTTSDGPKSLPCVFRQGGLAIATEESLYSITHEASGLRLAPVFANGTHALVTTAVLLDLPLDWTRSTDELRPQMAGLSPEHMSLLHTIHAGRTQFVDMAKAVRA